MAGIAACVQRNPDRADRAAGRPITHVFDIWICLGTVIDPMESTPPEAVDLRRYMIACQHDAVPCPSYALTPRR